jgi:hypothetical protein
VDSDLLETAADDLETQVRGVLLAILKHQISPAEFLRM